MAFPPAKGFPTPNTSEEFLRAAEENRLRYKDMDRTIPIHLANLMLLHLPRVEYSEKYRFYEGEMRILMVGLKGAGKTHILHEVTHTINMSGLLPCSCRTHINTISPALGFQVETVECKKVSITSWDVGGEDMDKFRSSWKPFFHNVQGIIFVVDGSCTDCKRIDEARDELHRIINEDELRDAVILVLQTKEDVRIAKGLPDDFDIKLGLTHLHHRKWYIQKCCPKSKQGTFYGLLWLSDNIANKENGII